MLFESLANELVLDVFEYLNISQLLRAFRSLNSRFDKLLSIYFQNIHHLDFRSISQHNMKFLCQYHLRSLAHQILSLTLSNDDETPQQLQFFFSHHFTLQQFIHLQFLSFHQIHSDIDIQTILIDLLHLSNLTHLNFLDCSLSSFYQTNDYLIDNIWKLPKLIQLQFHDISNKKLDFISPRSIVSSVEYISIQNLSMTMNDIYHLLRYKPYLQHVRVYVYLDDENINVIEHFPSIIKFELYDERSYSTYIDFGNYMPASLQLLTRMSNLYQLTIETPFVCMDGHRWKCFIMKYLPKLEIFRFKMAIYFNNFDKIKQRINYIFDSFQSQFWIDKHRWFVRCHWNSENEYNQCILFYTLPYTFSYLSITNNHLWSKSTCPHSTNHWSSSHIHHLSYNAHLIEHIIPTKKSEDDSKFNIDQRISSTKINKLFRLNLRKTESFSLLNNHSTIIPSSFDKTVKILSFTDSLSRTSPLRNFPHIQKLTIGLPFDTHSWWNIPKLNRLNSLHIKLSIQNINQMQLQILLDQAPCLYSLNVNLNLTSSFDSLPIHNNSTSIRRLNFKENIQSDQCFFFNHEQCIALSHSSLGEQCEILTIGVRHRKSILFLINTMNHLRALNVRCQDEQYGKQKLSLKHEELIQWLRHRLPSTITIERYNLDIRLWIK